MMKTLSGSQGIESVASDPVDQETVTNFELGMKADFFDNTLRLNMTAYYMDYDDLQIVRFGPVPGSEFGTFITTNVGSADIKGLETEFTWSWSPGQAAVGMVLCRFPPGCILRERTQTPAGFLSDQIFRIHILLPCTPRRQ